MLRQTLLAAALFSLAACASSEGTQTANAAPGERDCFRAEDVYGYSIIDNNHVNLRARGRDYIMTTAWNARDLDWSHAIAIRSTSGWICTGSGLGVEIVGGPLPRTYPITSIARAPEEAPPTGS